MTKILIFIISIYSLLLASDEINTCKKCHPIISKEFQNSMHKKSSIYGDKIHRAVWNKHPAKAKNNYKCAKCHTPDDKSKIASKKGISCSSCHTIKDVEVHSRANKNIYAENTNPKTFFSAQKGRESEKVTYEVKTSMLSTSVIGSPYHNLDYTNKNFYTGKMCMGCHSHKQNGHKFTVCMTDEEGAQDTKENCITCHMPKVLGSATTIRISKKHAFHGFAGAIYKPEMLSKHVELSLKKLSDGFNVTIINKAPHNLMTHPLRVVQLRVNLIRDAKTQTLKTHTFVKIIGRDNKPSMPWVANTVLKDTMIKAKEKRVVKYTNSIKSGDIIEMQLGYYIVNQKALKKLNLNGDKKLKKFTILKHKNFKVN